jgi:small subunit ribosomal protein S15
MSEKSENKNPDTGSAEAQIEAINRRLDKLSEHFEKHPKDKHSRRGMLALINRRRRNLRYLEKNK